MPGMFSIPGIGVDAPLFLGMASESRIGLHLIWCQQSFHRQMILEMNEPQRGLRLRSTVRSGGYVRQVRQLADEKARRARLRPQEETWLAG